MRRGPSRFGPAAIVREGPASEYAHLLSLFVEGRDGDARGDDVDEDRRSSRRFRAVERRAWLGWWSSPRQFTTFAARLDDISQGGARLSTPDPPPAQEVVWLCLGAPDPTECVQAKVLAVTPTPDGVSIIRIAFGTPCPANLYQVAVSGLAARVAGDGRPAERRAIGGRSACES